MLLLTDLQGNKTNLVSFSDLRRKRAVNGDRSISLVVYYADVDNDAYDMVQEEAKIRLDGETYVIKMVEEEGIGASKTKTVNAIHEFFTTMIDGYLYDKINGTYQLHTMCYRIFEETPYTYQVVDTFDSETWENFGDDNRLALFQTVLERYGAEFEIVGTLIRLKKQVGNDTDFQLRFGFNTDAIEKVVDTTNLTTYVKGYGKPNATNTGYLVEGEYFSPNVSLYGVRHAKPVRDERITTTPTLNAAMKAAISDTPILSFKLAYKVLVDQGYDGTPNEGDRMFLIYIPLLINAWVRVMEVEDYFDNNLDIVDMDITIANKRKNIIDNQVQFSQTSKQVSKVFTPTGTVKDGVLSDEVKAATEAIQSAQTEVVFDNGIRLIDKTNNSKRVVLAAAGIGITNDGSATYKTALTGDGWNPEALDGTLGQAQVENLVTDLTNVGTRLTSLETTRTNQLNSGRGTTVERPLLTALDDGYLYYDRDIMKIILWNGTAWTNLDGTTL